MIARIKQRISMLATVAALSAATLAIFHGVAEAQSFATASATILSEDTQNNPLPSQPTSEPETHLVVKPGDSLWSISQERLHPSATPQQIMNEVWRIYELNRDRIGEDPNLILPGQQLLLSPVAEPTAAGPTVAEPEVAERVSEPLNPPVALPGLPEGEVTPAVAGVVQSSPEFYGNARKMLGLGVIALTLLIAITVAWRLPMKRSVEDPTAWRVPLGRYGGYSENYAVPISSSDLKDASSPTSPSLAATRGPMRLVPEYRSNGPSTTGYDSTDLAMVKKKAPFGHQETLPTTLGGLEVEDARRSEERAASVILLPVAKEEYYTPPQAARILKLSRQRITQMLQSGEIEGKQDPKSGRWRIPRSVVHARLKDRLATRHRSNDGGPQSAPEGSQRLKELEAEVRDLSYRLGRSEALLEVAESNLRVERDRLLEELKRERERADRLERELEEARRQGRRRLFGN